jgi:hypothetical protein
MHTALSMTTRLFLPLAASLLVTTGCFQGVGSSFRTATALPEGMVATRVVNAPHAAVLDAAVVTLESMGWPVVGYSESAGTLRTRPDRLSPQHAYELTWLVTLEASGPETRVKVAIHEVENRIQSAASLSLFNTPLGALRWLQERFFLELEENVSLGMGPFSLDGRACGRQGERD